MQLEEMSLQERHELAVVVTLACIRRLEAIIERSGPRDETQERRLDLLARKAVDRAELLEVHRRGKRLRKERRFVWHHPARGEMYTLRRASWPRLHRWSSADRSALLHELCRSTILAENELTAPAEKGWCVEVAGGPST